MSLFCGKIENKNHKTTSRQLKKLMKSFDRCPLKSRKLPFYASKSGVLQHKTRWIPSQNLPVYGFSDADFMHKS